MRRLRNVAFSIFLSISALVFGYSQSNESSPLDSIAFDIDFEDIVVTAQYKPTHYKKALNNIDIIDKKVIEERGITHLDEALLISPGIRLKQDNVLGTQVTLRGLTGNNVAILIDGVPMIGRSNGSIDISQIPLQNIERIEVVQGPLSNFYGNNAAGGVINIITKQAQINSISGSVSGQIESIGAQNLTANVGYQKNKFRISGYGRNYNYDQYPIDSLRIIDRVLQEDGSYDSYFRYPWKPKKQYGYGSSFSYRINDDSKLLLKYDSNSEELSDYGSVKRPNFNPYATDIKFETDRNDIALLFNAKVLDLAYIDFTLSNNRFKRLKTDYRYYIESMTIDPDLTVVDTTTFDAYFSRLNLTFPREKFEYTFGLAYNREIGKGGRILDTTRDESDTAEANEAAIYSAIQYTPRDNIKLSLSGRLTKHSYYDYNFTPALLLKYDLNEKVTLRGSYAYGYRSPELKELHIEFIDVNHFVLGNVDLKPEISKDIQLGVDYSNRGMNVGFLAYSTNVKDQIILSQYEPLRFQYQNIDKFDVFGFQLSYGLMYKKFFLNSGLNLGYWSTGTSDEFNTPTYSAIFDMNHSLGYRNTEKMFSTTINYRRTGAEPSYNIENGVLVTKRVEAIDFLDLLFSKYFFKNKLTITLGVKNILGIKTVGITSSDNSTNHTDDLINNVSRGRNFVLIGKYEF